MTDIQPTMVLIRHGSSDWNLSGRFTGWADITLTEKGLAQAESAGKRLAAEGYIFDEVHTSVLRRTHQTADILLAAAHHPNIPRYSSWHLNERHYGQLQGLSKQEIFSTWGEQNSHRWWRGYFDPPPPLEKGDPRCPRLDPLYANIDKSLLPRSESLYDCQRRLLPYWESVLLPRLAENKKLLIVSHGNTIRGLIMYLEKITPEEIEKVEIPSGVPLVFKFNNRLELLNREWLD